MAANPPLRYSVILSGNEAILRSAMQRLQSSDIVLTEEDGEVLLTSPRFERATTMDEVWEAASKMLPILASGLRLAGHTVLEPLGIDGVRESSPAGPHTFAKRFTADAVLISDVVTTSINGQPPAPPPPIRIDVALRNPLVMDVFERFAAAPTWVNLANVVELIEHDVGGETEIAKRGWATKSELKLFQHTANNMHAVGVNARHAEVSRQPPAKPMPLEDAARLVKLLVERWLQTK